MMSVSFAHSSGGAGQSGFLLSTVSWTTTVKDASLSDNLASPSQVSWLALPVLPDVVCLMWNSSCATWVPKTLKNKLGPGFGS